MSAWRRRTAPQHPYLDSVLDFAGVVSDDEGGLHDGGELDVAVSFMLTLELVQQGLIGGLRETGGNGNDLISTGGGGGWGGGRGGTD